MRAIPLFFDGGRPAGVLPEGVVRVTDVSD